jgi:hypothetical protein
VLASHWLHLRIRPRGSPDTSGAPGGDPPQGRRGQQGHEGQSPYYRRQRITRTPIARLFESVNGAAKAYRLMRAVLMTAVKEDELIRKNPCRIPGPTRSTRGSGRP